MTHPSREGGGGDMDSLTPRDETKVPSIMLRYCNAGGQTIEDQRAYARATRLADIGDAVLIWANEGDLAQMQIEGRAAQYTIGTSARLIADMGIPMSDTRGEANPKPPTRGGVSE